jgi:hypothetical protein
MRVAYELGSSNRRRTTTPTTSPASSTTGDPLSPDRTSAASTSASRSWTTPALTSSTRRVTTRSTVVGRRPSAATIVTAEDGIDAIHLTPDGDHPGAQAEEPTAFASRYVREVARVPVLRNGLFLTEAAIRTALENGSCDAVTLTRPLVRQASELGPSQAA